MIKKQLFVSLLAMPLLAQAQNPVIRDQFAADPTARVFNDKVYLYPSHDIFPPEGQRQDWFCMEDYHVFSSENLTDWTDHGVIVTQNKVPWVKPDHPRTAGASASESPSPTVLKDRSSLSLRISRASVASTPACFRLPTAMPTSSGVQDVVLNSSPT